MEAAAAVAAGRWRERGLGAQPLPGDI